MNQLKAGAILSYLSITISMLIALIYTPIMIRILGQSEFGLYSLIGSLAAYFSVMDMGLGNAMVRYTARNRVSGTKERESNLNGMFLIFYSIISLITIIVGIVVYNNLHLIFEESLSSSDIKSAKIMIVILIVNFALSFPLSIFNSILKAHERFIVEKVISIIRIVSAPLIILPIIYIGFGAISMVLITTIVNIGCLVFTVYYTYKNLCIKISFGRLEEGLIREVLTYSFFVFLAVIVDQIYWQTDQIILGAVSGTLSVAIYAIAIQFVKLYIQLSTSISGLFLPKVSMLVAQNTSSDELTTLMIRYGRVQFFIVTFILLGFTLFGEYFIRLWAGENYVEAYKVVLIIMVPLTIPLIQNFGLSVLYAMNLQVFRSVMLIFIAIINVIISIPVATEYGLIGVATVTAITLLLGNVFIMNIYYYKKIDINIPQFWKEISSIIVYLLFSLGIGYLINYLIQQNSIFFFIGKIILYSIIHVIILVLFCLNDYEKNLCKSVFRRLGLIK